MLTQELSVETPRAAEKTPRPMLASAMTTRGSLDIAPFMSPAWVLEEKFDGIRVVVRKRGDTIRSWSRPRAGRDALPRTLPPHIQSALRTLPDGEYDGELLSPGGRSWKVARLDGRSEQVLVLFDLTEVFGRSIAGRPYQERRSMLELAVAHYTEASEGGTALSVPPTCPVSLDAVQAIWDRGGEGAILKRLSSIYQAGKRSPEWVKVKRLHHETVTITGFTRGKAASSTPWNVTLFRRDNGKDGRCGTPDRATAAAISRNPEAFIGRRLVIAYTELTDSGSFRHGGWDHLAGEGE